MTTQKFMYLVEHAIPFPSSEYGGLWNVIASDDEECFDLISNTEEYTFYTEYLSHLRENIKKAQVFPLDGEYESEIAESFLT
jgi:hypothetical protein